MNLCWVCNEYPPAPYGGIGNGTRILARAAVRAGHKVRVVGVYRPERAKAGVDMDQGVEVHRINTRRPDVYSIRARRELYSTLSAWARRGEIDIVEVPDPEGYAAGWPSLPVPVTARIHGSISYFAAELGRRNSRVTYWAERASLVRADFWSSVSRYAEEKTREVFRLKTRGTVLHPAVELPDAADWSARNSNKVVYAGTLTLKKGILSLVKAWPSVAKEIPQAELHVFGKETRTETGELMSAFLLSHVEEAFKDRIVFHGHASVESLANALRTARVAVYPSFAEAFAAAPMEAMAQGCPTVYSLRTSGRELIEHGQDGLLIDPAEPDQIAKSIRALIQDENLARRIGEAGREKIRHSFTSDRVIDQLVGYYSRCVNEFAGHHGAPAPVCSSRS